jgi:hypothetical protein
LFSVFDEKYPATTLEGKVNKFGNLTSVK